MKGLLNIFILWLVIPFIVVLVGDSNTTTSKKPFFDFINIFEGIKVKMKLRKINTENRIAAIKEEIEESKKEEKVKNEDIVEKDIVENSAIKKKSSEKKKPNILVNEETKIENKETVVDDNETLIICKVEYEEHQIDMGDIPCYNPNEDIKEIDEVIETSVTNREPWHEILKAESPNLTFDKEDLFNGIKEYKIIEKTF